MLSARAIGVWRQMANSENQLADEGMNLSNTTVFPSDCCLFNLFLERSRLRGERAEGPNLAFI